MKQTVVILSGVFPTMRCGVSFHTWVVAQAVSKLGTWDVHVLTSDNPDVDKNLKRDFELHPVMKKWSALSLPGIVGEIEKLQPDVLHVQNPTNAYNGKLNFTMAMLPRAGKRLWAKTRLVVTQHDLAIGHWISQWKHGLLLKHSDAITVSNDRDYQAVLRISQKLKGRTYVARVASHFSPRKLSHAERDEVRNELKVPQNGALLMYFGFIVPGRRIDTLIRTAALFRAGGLSFRLVLMGGPGPGADEYMASCKALTAQLALNDCVTWTGYAEPALIEKTIPAADIFISPIERGADFRNSSFFPAIQSGVPILTTENPKYGIDRELRAWNICRFFDPASPKSLAEAVSALLKDEDAKRQIRTAMARLAPRLTWEEHARVLDMAYRGEPPEPYDPVAGALKDKR